MSKYDLLTDTVEVFNNEFDMICESIDRNAQLLNSQCMRLFFQSGFGLEGIKFRLTRTASELRKCSDQVRMEKQALNRINVITQNADGYAHSILSGEAFTPKEMPGADYDKTGLAESIFNFIDSGIDRVKDFAHKTLDVIHDFYSDACDGLSYIADLINDLKLEKFSTFADVFYAFGVAQPFVSLVTSLMDMNIDFKELLEITGASVSAFEPAAKLIGSLFNVDNWEAIEFLGTTAKEAATWLSVVGAFLKIGAAGYEAYEKYGADGEMTIDDWSQAGIDVGVKGLIAVTGALVSIACPPASIIFIGYAIADNAFGLTDMGIEAIKDWARKTGQSLAAI